MLLEATTEVLKMASSPVGLLFQALHQYVTKMAARSVFEQFSWFHFPNVSVSKEAQLHPFEIQLETCLLNIQSLI